MRGDAAVVEFTNRFDRTQADTLCRSRNSLAARLQAALLAISGLNSAAALEVPRRNVCVCTPSGRSWKPGVTPRADGTLLGQQVTPLDRVGLYVPGGKAAYPSSVLMNAIPAKVAGVPELIMVVPTPGGEVNELVLAAAAIAGVDRVFTHRRCAGGGGPGLRYRDASRRSTRSSAPAISMWPPPKRMVFGTVGIDMIAGPSEILVICDGLTDPDWIAMDLFSQAEHDEDAQPILVCPDGMYLQRVRESIERLLPTMERKDIIEASLTRRAALIQVRDLNEAADVANYVAPEHLELSVAEPQALAQRIKHAGAIFMGRYTAEALGDYCAGPNHVLPTSRTARFSSPLGVYDFQKRTSLIMCSPEGASELGKTASVLARGEGLTAHALFGGIPHPQELNRADDFEPPRWPRKDFGTAKAPRRQETDGKAG